MTPKTLTRVAADHSASALLTPVRRIFPIFAVLVCLGLMAGILRDDWRPLGAICTLLPVFTLFEVLWLWTGPRRTQVSIEADALSLTTRGSTVSWPLSDVREIEILGGKGVTPTLRVVLTNGRHRDVKILLATPQAITDARRVLQQAMTQSDGAPLEH